MAARLFSWIHRYRKEILCFTLPMIVSFAVNLLLWNHLIYLGPDARLYYSIAENFCNMGHFIQTARDIQSFVVPFGVPLILTLLRIIGLNLPMIIALQYVMLGTACLLLYRTEQILFGRGGFAPAFYCIALFRAQIDLYDIYVEHYALLLMIIILYLSARKDMPEKKRLTGMNLAGAYMAACRPVLTPVYIAVLLFSLMKLVQRNLPVKRFALLLLIPIVLFGANTLVNYRETGYLIVMDSYSGKDFYAANNANVSTEYYTRKVYDTFDEEYTSVENNSQLDQPSKNEIYKQLGKKWIWENPGTFLSNTITKFVHDFVGIWRGALVACFLGAFHMLAAFPRHRKWTGITLLVNLIVAFLTAMGLVMARYTIVVWPLASVHLAAITYPMWDLTKRIFFKRSVP